MKKLLKGILIYSLVVAGGYTALRLKGIERIEIIKDCPEKPQEVSCPEQKTIYLERNTSHDTHIARCYRCALGQNIEKTNEKFCKEYYEVWNVDKDQAKDICK